MTRRSGDNLKNISQGAGLGVIGRLTSAGIKFGTQILLAWCLGAKYFGLYALAIAIYNLSELVATLGLQSGTVKRIATLVERDDAAGVKGVLIQAVSLPFLSGLILGIVLLLSAGVVARDIFGKAQLEVYLQLVSCALPFGSVMIVSAFASTGFKTAKFLVITRDLINPVVNIMVIIVACLLGYGLFGALVAWCAAAMAGMVSGVWFLRRCFPELTNGQLAPAYSTRALFRVSLPLAYGSVSWLLLLWSDTLVLGFFRPAEDVGIYRGVAQTALLLIIFSQSLNTMFAPSVAQVFEKRDFDQLSGLYKTVNRWGFVTTVPFILVLSIVGGDVLLIYGRDFTDGAVALAILACGYAAYALGGGAAYMLAMAGREKEKMWGDILLSILNIFLNIVLIPGWGIEGAAVATGLSLGLVSMVRVIQVRYTLKMHPYSFPYLKALTAGTVAGAIGLILANVVTGGALQRVVVVSTGVFASYILVIMLLRQEREDIQAVRGLIARLSSGPE